MDSHKRKLCFAWKLLGIFDTIKGAIWDSIPTPIKGTIVSFIAPAITSLIEWGTGLFASYPIVAFGIVLYIAITSHYSIQWVLLHRERMDFRQQQEAALMRPRLKIIRVDREGDQYEEGKGVYCGLLIQNDSDKDAMQAEGHLLDITKSFRGEKFATNALLEWRDLQNATLLSGAKAILQVASLEPEMSAFEEWQRVDWAGYIKYADKAISKRSSPLFGNVFGLIIRVSAQGFSPSYAVCNLIWRSDSNVHTGFNLELLETTDDEPSLSDYWKPIWSR